jgi:adenylate cyclase class 2
MREVEIKARVADKSKLLQILKAQDVKLSDAITQRDRVWLPEGAQLGKGFPSLRIRTETNAGATKNLLTLKKKAINNQMDSIEHETEVHDEQELAHIIKHLGFVPYSDSTKTRQKAHIGGIEICIDTVEGLGDFVELEKLTEDDTDYDEIAEELWAILEKFGVVRADQVTDGYDVLMRKSLGLKV